MHICIFESLQLQGSYTGDWGFPGGSEKKNMPAMQETQVQPLGWEDPLEEGMVTHSSILAWRIPDRGAWWATVHRVAQELEMTEVQSSKE